MGRFAPREGDRQTVRYGRVAGGGQIGWRARSGWRDYGRRSSGSQRNRFCIRPNPFTVDTAHVHVCAHLELIRLAACESGYVVARRLPRRPNVAPAY